MRNLKTIILVVANLFFSHIGKAQTNTDQQKNDNMNQLVKLHDNTKPVSAQVLFSTTEGKVMTLQIQKNGLLKEHVTKVETLLVCVLGEVIYEDEKGKKVTLKAGELMHIEPMVKHWVNGVQDSQLLLIK